MVTGNLAKKIGELVTELEKDYTFLPDKPKHTSVSLLDIVNNNYRFEAFAFNLEAKVAFNKVKECKYGYINLWGNNGLVANAFYPGRFKRIYVSKGEGYPFYLPSQLTEVYPKPTKFISEKTYNEIKGIEIESNNLLLTRSGTIGKCSISSRTNIGKVYSDDVIRVSFHGKYDLGYVYAFVQSEIGQLILKTNNYGAVVQHIEPEHLENVVIPNAPEKIKRKVHELVVKSYDLRDQSNELIDKAEKMLYEELQLPPIEELQPKYFDASKDIRNYQTNLSGLNLRFDGSYHLPIVKAIEETLEKTSLKVVEIKNKGISKTIFLPGRFKRIYVDKKEFGIKFIGGKQINDLNPDSEKYLSKTIHHYRAINELILSENTILITRSGTIGKVSIVPKHWSDWAANEHIIRVFPTSNEIAGYLFCWLNSEYGNTLTTKHNYCSVVNEIDTNHVGDIKIPLLKNESKQKEINDLVLKANELRYEAHLKEQEAIRIVNEDVINETKYDRNFAAEPKVKYKKPKN